MTLFWEKTLFKELRLPAHDVSSYASNKVAGAFSRLFGLFFDLALGQILFHYLLSFPRFEGHYKAILRNLNGVSWLHAWWGQHLELLSSLVLVLILAQILRFYGNCLLGVSLGQWIMGIRAEGTFLWKRAGGSARVLISCLLGPFLIFDLPCFLKKRTIKEVLSQTSLIRNNSSWAAMAFRGVILSSLVVLALYSPLLQNLTIIDGIKVAFSDGERPVLNNKTDFNKFKTYSSNRFRFSAFSSLQNNRFVLIPSFEVLKAKEGKRVRSILIIYDKANQRDGYLKKLDNFSLLRLLKEAKLGNPFFSMRFNQLTRIFKEGKDKYERRDYQASYGKNLLLNPLIIEEIEEVVQSSFELSLKNLFTHSFNYGPFIRGLVQLRNNFLDRLNRGSIPEIGITYLGDHRFLRMVQVFEGIGKERKDILE